MTPPPMTRDALLQLHEDLSRRRFFSRTVKAAGLALFWDRFGEKLFGQSPSKTDPYAVLSALGNNVIPIDDDPGYASFDPGITQYTLNSFVANVMLNGNPVLFAGAQGAFQAFNDLPPLIGYSTSTFLNMSLTQQSLYLGNIFSNGFESYGTQDLMFTAFFIGLFATKAVFFSNYPSHLATPGAEFQTPAPSKIKTAWQIIGYRGAVSAAEEAQLRARYSGITTLPGMDPANTYI